MLEPTIATTQAEASPVPTAAPRTLLQEVDADLARLREERFENSAQSQRYHAEIIAIGNRLRESGVPLDEVERLQARKGSLSQANATGGTEDARLEREIRIAGERRETLIQERRAYQHLTNQLKANISDQRTRAQMLAREAQQASQQADEAETQLRNVIARLEQLGEAVEVPQFLINQW